MVMFERSSVRRKTNELLMRADLNPGKIALRKIKVRRFCDDPESVDATPRCCHNPGDPSATMLFRIQPQVR